MIILEILLAMGGPALTLALKLLPIFYQYKILKTEAEFAEWQRRVKAAIAEAESKAKDPVGAKAQYDAAKAAAKKKLQNGG
jgi:hypothetical protein